MKHMKNYPECNGQKYYVSTTNTADRGLETMVFKCDENQKVHDWCELYVEHYTTEHDAIHGHMRICHNIEKYVGEAAEEKPEENVHDNTDEDEKTVTITKSELMEALAFAWSEYTNMADDEKDKTHRLLEALTKGGLISCIVASKLFDEEPDEEKGDE